MDFSPDVSDVLRPPEMESQMVNKTVRACCEGWGGPRCSEGEDKKPNQSHVQYACIILVLHVKLNMRMQCTMM